MPPHNKTIFLSRSSAEMSLSFHKSKLVESHSLAELSLLHQNVTENSIKNIFHCNHPLWNATTIVNNEKRMSGLFLPVRVTRISSVYSGITAIIGCCHTSISEKKIMIHQKLSLVSINIAAGDHMSLHHRYFIILDVFLLENICNSNCSEVGVIKM